MKTINSILLLFSVILLNAQSFGNVNNHWIYSVPSLEGQKYIEFRVIGDIEVDGIPSKQIKKTLITYIPQGNELVRIEDIELGTDVWSNQNGMISRYSNNQFLPLFPLNPNLGDEWTILLSDEYPCASNNIENNDQVSIFNTGTTTILDRTLNHKGMRTNENLTLGWKVYENIGPNVSPYPLPGAKCTEIDTETNAPGNLVCYSDGVGLDLVIYQTNLSVCQEQRLNTVNSTTSTDNSIIMYPNPADNIVNFSQTIKNISLYNSNGQLVLSAKNTNQLQIKNLPNGLYIVVVNEKGESFTLIKK